MVCGEQELITVGRLLWENLLLLRNGLGFGYAEKIIYWLSLTAKLRLTGSSRSKSRVIVTELAG